MTALHACKYIHTYDSAQEKRRNHIYFYVCHVMYVCMYSTYPISRTHTHTPTHRHPHTHTHTPLLNHGQQAQYLGVLCACPVSSKIIFSCERSILYETRQGDVHLLAQILLTNPMWQTNSHIDARSMQARSGYCELN